MLKSLKGLAIVGGLLLVVLGIREARISTFTRPSPQTLTCADLAARGPGKNANIILTDFALGENVVIETRKKRGATIRTTYWVPAMTPEAALDQKPEAPRVIVKTSAIRSPKGLADLERSGRLAGLVINRIDDLDADTRNLLLQGYPGIALDRCWIVEHGRKPAGTVKLMGMLGGGGALVLLGVGWVIVAFKKGERLD